MPVKGGRRARATPKKSNEDNQLDNSRITSGSSEPAGGGWQEEN